MVIFRLGSIFGCLLALFVSINGCIINEVMYLTGKECHSSVEVYFGIVKSHLQCGVICHHSDACNVLKFNERTMECRGMSPIFLLNCTNSDPDIKYYGHCSRSASYGESCTETKPCLFQDTVKCTNDKCKCRIGYSLLPGFGACLAECEEYGETFTKYYKEYIVGHDKTNEETTVEACLAGCLAWTAGTCRSIEWVNEIRSCRVQEVGWLDVVPEEQKMATATHYYHRNCKGLP